jgi:hypothetical protein
VRPRHPWILTGVLFLTVYAPACGGRVHVPEPTTPPDTPRISWMLERTSSDQVNADEVCNSNKRDACTLAASSDSKVRIAHFDLWLHPAVTQVTYTGMVEIGFLGEPGGRPARLDIKQELPSAGTDARPTVAAMSGVVTTRPGEYQVTINLQAVSGTGEKLPVQDRITVTVGGPAQ